jgi:hypothetical protein
MLGSSLLEHELSRIGATQLLDNGKSKQAAALTFQRLLKEALPAELRRHNRPSNLYDMLSYLIDRSQEFGFTCKSKIERESIVFVVRNDALQENRVVPILLELLLAQIFEQLSNMEPEITQSGKEIIVKIRL